MRRRRGRDEGEVREHLACVSFVCLCILYRVTDRNGVYERIFKKL